MTFVLSLAVGLWLLGAMMKTPTSARWLMIGLVYVGVLAASLIFPDGHPIRLMLGGSSGEWLIVGILAGVVWLYSQGLAMLRARVRPENRPKAEALISDEAPSSGEIERNSRHILLREIGGPGQARLKAAKVLVVGAGGLGSPILQYLGGAGVGTIGVIDHDVVEASNLQRQIIHTDARTGMPKVFSAEAAIKAQNPFVTVRPYHRKLDDEIAEELFRDYDLVLDGCDDDDTRYLVNATAQKVGIPLIFGALSQWEGQVAVFQPGGPCYNCLFPTRNAPGTAPTCAEGGVLSVLPGVIGSIMAAEAVKLITGAGQPLKGLLIYDALWGETRTVAFEKDPNCKVRRR